MQRRQFISSLSGLIAFPIISRPMQGVVELQEQDIQGLYDRSIVIDCLATPGTFNIPWPPPGPLSEIQLENATLSGITAVNQTVSARGFQETVKNIALWQGEIDTHSGQFLQVKRVSDLDRAKSESKLGIIFGFQHTECIGRDLTLLDTFFDLGVRIVQLTYNVANFVGAGCLEPRDGGLTKFGREAVARLDELGVVVDLSHCGQRATADAIEASTKPVVISHSGCREVYRTPRSKEDSELKAMADKGGVLGIYCMPFLGYGPFVESEQKWALRKGID